MPLFTLRLLASILLLIGLALAIPGVELLRLGGSAYYVVAGILSFASGILLWQRSKAGAWLYALLLAGTIGWALWEVGLDGWALLPRIAGPIALGLWLIAPWSRRALGFAVSDRAGRRAAAIVAIAVIGFAGAMLWLARAPGNAALSSATARAVADWPHYGNDAGGSRFSPLTQIDPANVGGLEPAWTYHIGAPPPGAPSSFEATPLAVNGRLYLCSGYNDVVALDGETGRQLWRFTAHVDRAGVFAGSCRGVSYYKVPGAQGPCAERIYTATVDARLIALDALSGRPCPSFGKNGVVSLLQGMGDVWHGYYFVTSPPQVVRGKLVLGGWVTDGQSIGEPAGVIRAFDAVTGAFAWAFDPGKPDDHGMPPAGQQFTRGTPNSWAPMSADEQLGLVYVPTGNATPDYFGGERTANDDRFSSAVIALDAESGAARWVFQTTHHDLWDYDVPAQPTLVDLPGGVKALIQPTKRGEIFLLDRRTGKPIAAVTEKPVPQKGVPGERLSPTQPFSTGLPSFAGPQLTEATMWGITPFDQLWCRIAFRKARYDGPLTPVVTDRPTIEYPGYLGGIDWGGVSVDADRGVMLVNSDRVANYDRLLLRAEADRRGLKPMHEGHMGDVGGPAAQAGTPYAADIRPFLSPIGVPCQQPPYGMLSAVDLKSGRMVWTQRLGSAADSGPIGLASHLPIPMGVPNIGGSVTTRGGIFFVAATQDRYLRAFDTRTGRELWRGRLPAGGQATPMTFGSPASGRQFVVVAAGGHGGLGTKGGDALVAYALPRR
jgi:quinoprotein glucose dehydrogenase